MYLAYSALHTTEQNNLDTQTRNHEHELQLRYRTYQATCDKYSSHIAEIQKYFPGWMPKFR